MAENVWKILGKEAMYIEFADVLKERLLEIAPGIENSERFTELLKDSEVTHIFNGSTETHGFNIRPDAALSPEDIQYMADIILAIAQQDTDRFFVSLDDEYQKCVVNVRNDVEPELIGANRTEGYGSGKIFMPILDSLCKPGRTNESFL
ncbi:MAG: hypothetical protein ACI4Q9_02745 [Candidatus Methanomethylophilaceae archaeon]